MTVGANDHGGLFDLPRVIRLYNINDVKAAECGKAMLPHDARAIALDLVGHGFGQFLKVFRISERIGRKAAKNYIRGYRTRSF